MRTNNFLGRDWIDAELDYTKEEWETLIDVAIDLEVIVEDWLPPQRPLRIGVLSGASTPEAVVGEVLQRLASFLGGE